MKFGVFDHMDRGSGTLGAQYEARLALIEGYEAAGFHAYFVAEHHSTPLGLAPSPSVFLAAASQRTRRLRLGAMVYTLSLYHPLRLIEEICMLDQLSGGRLELGVGRGIQPIEVAFYGLDPENRRAIYDEVLAILMQGMGARAVNFAGRFFRFDDVPVELECVQKPHPPLWYGVTRPESTIDAARRELNVGCNLPPALARKVTDLYRAEWQAAGKDPARIPAMGMTRHIVIDRDDRVARDTARRAYALWHRHFYLLYTKYGMTSMLNYPATFDELEARGEAAAGSPQRVRDLLAAQCGEAGTNYLFCRMAFGDLSLGESMRSLALFVDEVMPTLAAM